MITATKSIKENKKISVSEIITNRVINNLKNKNGEYSMPPWFNTPRKTYNPCTKSHFYGLNQLLLNKDIDQKRSDLYLREEDIELIGGDVADYAKPYYIIQPTSSFLFNQLKYTNDTDAHDLKVKYLKVYNYDDVYNISPSSTLAYLNLYEDYIFKKRESNNIVRAMVKGTDLRMILEGKESFYDKKRDILVMPSMDSYNNISSFYGNLFRVLSFAVSHPKRLNMPEIKFSKEIYTVNDFNEKRVTYSSIVADMTMAYISSKLNNPYKVQRSNEYIYSLINTLKDNHTILLKASYQSYVISNYLLKLGKTISI